MRDLPSSSSGYRVSNSTADRALQILDLFTDEHLVIGGAEVAAALSTSRSTAYRYLQSLVASSFLEKQAGGGFRLGPRILELARLARRGYGVLDVARPVMRRLRDEWSETILLTRRSGDRVVCLDREEAQSTVRISYERGSFLPLHAGASALVLLAWLPIEEARQLLVSSSLEQFTNATVTDPEALMLRLAAIRREGYAVSRGELDSEVLGIAAPIRGGDGGVVAGLSMAALERRVPRERVGAAVQSLRGAALEIERLAEGADAG